MKLGFTVVVCAHNEEAYIEGCLKGILGQTVQPLRIILIADRCEDQTVKIARRLLPEGSVLVEKKKAFWRNSYAENLEIGRLKAVGEILAIVDADILVPPTFLERLSTDQKEWVSISALVKTDPSMGCFNRLVSVWEKTYLFAPLGREARGGARVVSLGALKEVGGFRDVMAPDTELDIRLRQGSKRVKMDTGTVALHKRRMTPRRSISYQIRAGRARRELGISPFRTILHSLGRLRPFVLYGYFRAGREAGGRW